METFNFKAAVIGAGPAGIFAVSELLARSVSPIAWIDPNFNGGALQNYHSIPSNTKASSFLNCCYESNFFCQYKEEIQKPFKDCDVQQTCSLTLAHQMLQIMTNILMKHPSVISIMEQASKYEQTKPNEWRIQLQSSRIISTNVVILCTGSQNRCLQQEFAELFKSNENIKEIPLFSAMSQEKVLDVCTKDDVVTIVGDRHSAILALMNLYQLPEELAPKKMYLLYRNKLRFAEYLPDGRVKYDQSGLRGSVAEWAKETLIPQPPESIEMLYSNEDAMKLAFKDSTKYISAFGFTRSPIGEIQIAEGTVFEKNVGYDPKCGQLVQQSPATMSGMYGFGIAFPEVRTDVCGEQINAVGFHDFFEFINQVVKEEIVPYLMRCN